MPGGPWGEEEVLSDKRQCEASSTGKREPKKWHKGGTQAGWSQAMPSLNPYLQVVCFSVSSHGRGRASRREGKPDAEDNGLPVIQWPRRSRSLLLPRRHGWARLGTVGHGWAGPGGRGKGRMSRALGAMLQIQEKPRTLSRHDDAHIYREKGQGLKAHYFS